MHHLLPHFNPTNIQNTKFILKNTKKFFISLKFDFFTFGNV